MNKGPGVPRDEHDHIDRSNSFVLAEVSKYSFVLARRTVSMSPAVVLALDCRATGAFYIACLSTSF